MGCKVALLGWFWWFAKLLCSIGFFGRFASLRFVDLLVSRFCVFGFEIGCGLVARILLFWVWICSGFCELWKVWISVEFGFAWFGFSVAFWELRKSRLSNSFRIFASCGRAHEAEFLWFCRGNREKSPDYVVLQERSLGIAGRGLAWFSLVWMLERLSWLCSGLLLAWLFVCSLPRGKVCQGFIDCKIRLLGLLCSGLDFRGFWFLGLAFENFFKKNRAWFLLSLRALQKLRVWQLTCFHVESILSIEDGTQLSSLINKKRD